MTSLATIDDLTARVTIDIDADRADALLADASAAVRLYCGRSFAEETATERCRVRNGIARPKGSPIVSIDSVLDENGNAVPYRHVFGDRIEIGWQYYDTFEYNPIRSGLAVVDVTYTYGDTTVPDIIVAVVCQMAARAFGSPAEESGIQSETLGPYTMTIGSAAASGGVGMLQAERDILAMFRRVGGYIRVGD